MSEVMAESRTVPAMMTSTQCTDFLSELKATLSKLTTAYADPVPDTAARNVTVAETTVEHTHCNDERAETGPLCPPHSMLYGELSSVLEKRGQQQQQQQQQPSDAARVIESRLRPGKQ